MFSTCTSITAEATLWAWPHRYRVVDADRQVVEVWRPDMTFPTSESERISWRPDGASETFSLELAELFQPI